MIPNGGRTEPPFSGVSSRDRTAPSPSTTATACPRKPHVRGPCYYSDALLGRERPEVGDPRQVRLQRPAFDHGVESQPLGRVFLADPELAATPGRELFF